MIIATVDGSVRQRGGRRHVAITHMEMAQSEDRWDGNKFGLLRCYSCSAWLSQRTDHVAAIMACGAEEIRAALVEEGFDLDAFDAR